MCTYRSFTNVLGFALCLVLTGSHYSVDAQRAKVPSDLPVIVAPTEITPLDINPTDVLHHGAPTQNLRKVAMGMTILSKSLSTLVVVKDGLELTAPIEISIGHYGQGSRRITQNYSPAGNRFEYDDPAGNGQPRIVRLDISLREGQTPYSFSRELTLSPLFLVEVGPLTLKSLNDCENFHQGQNDIRVDWISPDHNKHFVEFDLSAGQSHTVHPFVWRSTDVPVSSTLQKPQAVFREIDSCSLGGCSFSTIIWGQTQNLMPGSTFTVSEEQHSGSCRAWIDYTVNYTLMTGVPPSF